MRIYFFRVEYIGESNHSSVKLEVEASNIDAAWVKVLPLAKRMKRSLASNWDINSIIFIHSQG